MSIYDRFGVRTIINAKGPSTRLSGGLLDPEVSAAMTEAAGYCVDMAELQAGASKAIAELTGAEAGRYFRGTGLLLGTAACMTGLDPGKMSRLPIRMTRSKVIKWQPAEFNDPADHRRASWRSDCRTVMRARAYAMPSHGRSRRQFASRQQPCSMSPAGGRNRRLRRWCGWHTTRVSR